MNMNTIKEVDEYLNNYNTNLEEIFTNIKFYYENGRIPDLKEFNSRIVRYDQEIKYDSYGFSKNYIEIVIIIDEEVLVRAKGITSSYVGFEWDSCDIVKPVEKTIIVYEPISESDN